MFSRFKRPIESFHKIWLGTIALGVVAAVVAGLLIISALDIGKSKYQAEFAQAASLQSGDQVTVAGISIGTVDKLTLAGDRVLVAFKIRNDVPLGRDTHAAIKLTTLLGSRYVELSPAGQGELSDETIPLSNTTVPYNLQEALEDATTTFGQIDADRITQSLTTLTTSFQGVPEALPEALRNLRSLSGVLADRRDQIRSLLSSTDTVAKTIHDQKANLGSLVLQGRDLLGELTSRREQIRRLFAGATALVDTVKRVLGENPGLNELLATMRELSAMLAHNDALLRNIVQVLPIPIRHAANAFGSGPAGDATLPAGPMVDSWMCAISGRAKQFNLVEYFKDCQ